MQASIVYILYSEIYGSEAFHMITCYVQHMVSSTQKSGFFFFFAERSTRAIRIKDLIYLNKKAKQS